MTHPLHILAFDPSTTCTGWARIHRDGGLLACGKFDLDRHPAANRPQILFDAVRALANDKRSIPDTDFAIEWPGQHSHRRIKGATGAGLAVYGTGPGIVYGALRSLVPDNRIHRFTPADWNPNGASKIGRAHFNRSIHPAYSNVADKGYDISDAISIGEFAFRRINLERATWTDRTA